MHRVALVVVAEGVKQTVPVAVIPVLDVDKTALAAVDQTVPVAEVAVPGANLPVVEVADQTAEAAVLAVGVAVPPALVPVQMVV